MEIYSHPDIESFFEIESNKVCIDCGAIKPKFASINNGTFICMKCSVIHKNFGLAISVVRSLQIDSWDDKQILFLKKGGNEKYIEFLKSYNIPLTATLDLKYRSNAIDYYRRSLRQEIEKELNENTGVQEIERPDLVTGLDILAVKYMNPNNDIIGTLCETEEAKPSFIENVGGFFSRVQGQVSSWKFGSKTETSSNVPSSEPEANNSKLSSGLSSLLNMIRGKASEEAKTEEDKK